jgi:pantothenate kinase
LYKYIFIVIQTEAVIYIQDEENKFSRLGIVALGGVFGLLATRKGSFLKRMTMASVTISGN